MAPYGWLGLALVALAWPVSWSHWRPWSDFGFFPLWLGYVVAVDALVAPRMGRSLLTSGPARALRVFVISSLFWWIFEAFDARVNDWHYLEPSPAGPLRFVIEASLDFSTVLPAVFETAALVNLLLPGADRMPTHPARRPVSLWWVVLGASLLALAMLDPSQFFAGIWLCLLFLVDPVNARLSRPTLLGAAAQRQWRPLLVLGVAGLVCGFLWEMWNWNSLPKWVYTIPLVPRQRLFEMPLLGYAGYIPFAMECFCMYQLAMAFWRYRPLPSTSPYLPLGADD